MLAEAAQTHQSEGEHSGDRMAYLDIDFVIPIALLAASIVGVVLVRMAILRGEKVARDRTQKLIERHGMSDAERASTD